MKLGEEVSRRKKNLRKHLVYLSHRENVLVPHIKFISEKEQMKIGKELAEAGIPPAEGWGWYEKETKTIIMVVPRYPGQLFRSNALSPELLSHEFKHHLQYLSGIKYPEVPIPKKLSWEKYEKWKEEVAKSKAEVEADAYAKAIKELKRLLK